MKMKRATKRVIGRQNSNIVLLILIWAAIGFVSGMLIGRLLMIFQLL